MSRWVRADLWWLEEEECFKNLRQRNTGLNIAIFKTYIAIALQSNFSSRMSKLSYSNIEDLTGLSRPMISRAIKELDNKNIINKKNVGKGRINKYELIDFDEGWAKLPYWTLKKELKNLSNRSISTLYALKNLLVILKYRDNNKGYTQIKHETLVEKTGTPTNKIKSANDILINHGIISLCRISNNEGKIYTRPNTYGIKGLTDSKVMKEIEA